MDRRENRRRLARPRLVALAAAGTLVLSLAITAVATSQTPVDWRGLPSLKRAMEERAEQFRLQGQANRAPKDPVKAPAAPPQSDAAPPRGIIAEGQAPFSSQDAVIRNQWQDVVDGAWVHAYAGALASDRSQGLVIVVRRPLDGSAITGDRYLTPTKAGAVHFVTANGLQLVLRSQSGGQLTFDLPSGTFAPP